MMACCFGPGGRQLRFGWDRVWDPTPRLLAADDGLAASYNSQSYV